MHNMHFECIFLHFSQKNRRTARPFALHSDSLPFKAPHKVPLHDTDFLSIYQQLVQCPDSLRLFAIGTGWDELLFFTQAFSASGKFFWQHRTEIVRQMQADGIQSHQAIFVRCCLFPAYSRMCPHIIKGNVCPYACRCWFCCRPYCKRSLSVSRAINSELVGFPLQLLTV